MNILVTGGCGFIGSHTIVELLNCNHKIVCVDNFVNSKQYVIERIKRIASKDFIFYEGNICNFSFLEQIFKENSIDCVVHFAALKSNAESIEFPGKYLENNLQGTFNLLTLMKKYNVRNIVFSSSATVYGDCKNVPILESEKIGDVISPYGLSKYLNELYLKDFCFSNNFKCIALRYFNPIGAHPSGLLGEDSVDDVPTNLMLYLLKVAKGELPFLRVFGKDYDTPDGTGIRDYIHVVDLAKGHVAAVNYFSKMNKNFDVFNLGTGKGYTVLELVKAFEKVNGINIPYRFVKKRPGDVEKSFANVDKANKFLGWKTEKTLEDCARDVWNFTKKKN